MLDVILCLLVIRGCLCPPHTGAALCVLGAAGTHQSATCARAARTFRHRHRHRQDVLVVAQHLHAMLLWVAHSRPQQRLLAAMHVAVLPPAPSHLRMTDAPPNTSHVTQSL